MLLNQNVFFVCHRITFDNHNVFVFFSSPSSYNSSSIKVMFLSSYIKLTLFVNKHISSENLRSVFSNYLCLTADYYYLRLFIRSTVIFLLAYIFTIINYIIFILSGGNQDRADVNLGQSSRAQAIDRGNSWQQQYPEVPTFSQFFSFSLFNVFI